MNAGRGSAGNASPALTPLLDLGERGLPVEGTRACAYPLNDPRLPAGFWQRVAVVDDCWEWIGSLNHAGYGRYETRLVGGRRNWRVHRLAYTVFVGEIEAGLTLDHLCRTRNCCNPAHLEPVTQRENTLRGNTLNAANVAKTHCRNGHPYDEGNTYVCPKGRRNCRICVGAARERYVQRRLGGGALPPRRGAGPTIRPRSDLVISVEVMLQ